MQINYCKRGNYEVIMNDNQICLLTEVDICITTHEKNRIITSKVPSKAYESNTIMIAQKELDRNFSFY